MSRRLKLTVAYEGTEYAGWQRQANALAVQQVLEEAIDAAIGTTTPIVGAGRTDSGVHAAAQVVSLDLEHAIACDDLVRALNARLPHDIRVRVAEPAFDGFDARHDAVTKTYRYAIWNGALENPFLRRVVWPVPQPLDLAAMQHAAATLVGVHDFAAFQAAGADAKTTNRRLLTSEVSVIPSSTDSLWSLPPATKDPPASASLIRYEVTGTGFLRHMVRNIVGTLVDIGCGRTPADEIAEILASRDRGRAGMTAPAQGLTLWQVEYGPGPRRSKADDASLQ